MNDHIFKLADRVLEGTYRKDTLEFLTDQIENQILDLKTAPKMEIKKLPAQKTKTKNIEIIVHGEPFSSLSKAAIAYGMKYSEAYKLYNKGIDVNEIFKRKQLQLEAESVDENGIVTKIRREQ